MKITRSSSSNNAQYRMRTLTISVVLALAGCAPSNHSRVAESSNHTTQQFYGTDNPFVKEAVYFVMTDRFVDGDKTNNYPEQGGNLPSFDLPLYGDNGETANVGYLGGDLRGVLNNGQYISDMGFTAVWLTPVVDNPDQQFSGGEAIGFGGAFKDGGKSAYHGYWASNFYKIDEHYPSSDLDYKKYTSSMRDQHGLKTVFDVVANHGSPSFTMPVEQEKFGELYDENDQLVADHQNKPPEKLDPNNPLHQFYHTTADIMQLSNLDEDNAQLRDYLINSYLYWIEQGADAFRIDTIKHVPHHFWQEMAARVRALHPNFFMFAESYDYNANFIAQHTLAKNGGISVLDFPGQKAITDVFESSSSDFSDLLPYLHLTHGPYANPYELTTFYDNHDMPRMNASDTGFIDANNWLFTSRGIPVVYQGSEIGFMRGKAEHQGNRNYLGQANVELAKTHPIHDALAGIANVRKSTPALQNGLQVNLEFKGDFASFYRVIQKGDIAQTALVLLNKSAKTHRFNISKFLDAGTWTEMRFKQDTQVIEQGESLIAQVPGHSVHVWVRDEKVINESLKAELARLMAFK